MNYIHPDQIISKQILTPEEVMEAAQLARLVEAHDDLAFQLEEGQMNSFLYYEEGVLVGYLSSFLVASATVKVIGFVHPDYRRQGVFRALIAALCDDLKQKEIDCILFGDLQMSEAGKAFMTAVGAKYQTNVYEITPQKCDLTAPARHQLTAYNNGDIDAFIANYAPDCVIEDGAGNVSMQGTAAMYDSYKRMFEASPDLYCHLVSRVIVGNYILDEERVTGRAGSKGESHVVAVYRVEDGLIQHVRFLR